MNHCNAWIILNIIYESPKDMWILLNKIMDQQLQSVYLNKIVKLSSLRDLNGKLKINLNN